MIPVSLASAPAPFKRDYRGVLNLSSNELDHPDLAGFFARFISSWADTGGVVNRYPFHPAATARVASLSGLDKDRVLLTAGSDDAIRMLAWTLASAAGGLVVQTPNYAGYGVHAAAAGVSVRSVPCFGQAPDERLQTLCEAVAARTGAVVAVVDPDPVEGTLLGVERLELLARVCGKQGSLLIVDTAYAAFADVDHTVLARERDDVLILRTYSKSHGLAGMRVAALFGGEEPIAALARWRPVNALSALALDLVVHCLADTAFFATVHADVVRWRGELRQAIQDARPGWTVSAGQGNFVLVDTGSATAAALAIEELADAGVAVRGFDDDTMRSRFRVTVAAPAAVGQFLAALAPAGEDG